MDWVRRQFGAVVRLGDNWDGYHAHAPAAAALYAASHLIVHARDGELVDVWPTVDGGVVVELAGGAAWWFQPDGNLKIEREPANERTGP